MGSGLPPKLTLLLLTTLGSLFVASASRNFTIQGDRFLKDGEPFQIISGSVHYFRIHPDYWEDRLLRARSLGLNAISTYVAWNVHEPRPGEFTFEGFADVERFLALAHKLGLLVLLRPGPYICAEWDNGGLPWWLASSQVTGGGTMKYRSSDAVYLGHVDRWFEVLLPRMRPFTYQHGGPVILVQVENEYGFYGPDEVYLRHLKTAIGEGLGNVLLYTTDPPPYAAAGTLKGEVLATVDFGPFWYNLSDAFGRVQRGLNPPGRSPPLCSEFYTGWLDWWGNTISNKSATELASGFQEVLQYAGGTGSVNLYVAHGGTNFGFWAGGQVDNPDDVIHWDRGESTPPDKYGAVITSYDYQAPISESGDYGQPGIGGSNKFDLLRAVITEHTGKSPPQQLPPPAYADYGTVALTQSAPLTAQAHHIISWLARWFPEGRGLASEVPLPMEEYGQGHGLIAYSTLLTNASALPGATLHFQGRVHDEAQLLLNGRVVGSLSRSGGTTLALPRGFDPLEGLAPGANASEARLDIVVAGVGRKNSQTDFDPKGLSSKDVLLSGRPLTGWEVYPLPLNKPQLDRLCFPQDLQPAPAPEAGCDATLSSGENCSLRDGQAANATSYDPAKHGPTFFRGHFYAPPDSLVPAANGAPTHYADSYLDFQGGNFSFGLAWINGFNLGYYWPARGPQMTLYVPGPILRCSNEVLLLELSSAAHSQNPTVAFTTKPSFAGPRKEPSRAQPLELPSEGPAAGLPAAAVGAEAAPAAVKSDARAVAAEQARLEAQPQRYGGHLVQPRGSGQGVQAGTAQWEDPLPRWFT